MASDARAGPAGGQARRVFRVALLSNAMHQDNYARAFARHPRLQISAVIDEPGQEPYVVARNQALAAQYGVPYHESLDALADPSIEVISIGAQIERRARLAVVAAGLGKHLWLDKPPAPSAGPSAEIAAAVEAAGVTALVVSHLAAPWVSALRDAIAGGATGDLQALHLDFHFAKGNAHGLAGRRVPSGTGPRDVWTFRDAQGGATDPTESSHHVIAKRELAEVGWYPLALVRSLCPLPVQRVYATAGAYFFPEHRDLGLEDFGTVMLMIEGGPVVTISTGRTGRRSHAGGGRMAVRATGMLGTLVLDGGQSALAIHGGDLAVPPVARTPAWGDSTGMPALVDHFVACLDRTAQPLLSARDAAGLLHVLDAAYESAAAGIAVDL